MPITFRRDEIPWLDGFAVIEGSRKGVSPEFCAWLPEDTSKEEYCKELEITPEQYDEAHQYAIDHAYEMRVNHYQHFLLFRQALWNKRAERDNR